jgi:hypothetical protein
LWVILRRFWVILAVIAGLFFMGTILDKVFGFEDTRPQKAREAFDRYQEWFDSLRRTKQKVDLDVGGVRIRCFGDESEKQAAWDREHRSKEYGKKWGPAASGVTVSSDPPEIWCDLREDRDGNIIFPMHVIGHELPHVMKLKKGGEKGADPDTLVNDIY